jgi:hypothetical protein
LPSLLPELRNAEETKGGSRPEWRSRAIVVEAPRRYVVSRTSSIMSATLEADGRFSGVGSSMRRTRDSM